MQSDSITVTLRRNAIDWDVGVATRPNLDQTYNSLLICNGQVCGPKAQLQCGVGFKSNLSPDMSNQYGFRPSCLPATTASGPDSGIRNLNTQPSTSQEFWNVTCGLYAQDPLIRDNSTRVLDNFRTNHDEVLRRVQQGAIDTFLSSILDQCLVYKKQNNDAVVIASLQAHVSDCRILVSTSIERAVARCGILDNLLSSLPLTVIFNRGSYQNDVTASMQLTDVDFVTHVFGYPMDTPQWTQTLSAMFTLAGYTGSSNALRMSFYRNFVLTLTPAINAWRQGYNVFLQNPSSTFAPDFPNKYQWGNFKLFTLPEAQQQSGSFNLQVFLNELFDEPTALNADFRVNVFNGTSLLPLLSQLKTPALLPFLQDYYTIGSVVSHLLTETSVHRSVRVYDNSNVNRRQDADMLPVQDTLNRLLVSLQQLEHVNRDLSSSPLFPFDTTTRYSQDYVDCVRYVDRKSVV